MTDRVIEELRALVDELYEKANIEKANHDHYRRGLYDEAADAVNAVLHTHEVREERWRGDDDDELSEAPE